MATRAGHPAFTPIEAVLAPVGQARVQWVDAARGLAMLLVVFGHASGGLIDAAGPGSLVPLRYIFLGIYTFHMPLFFFLSGLFIEQRLEKGVADFFYRLLKTIFWAYFLWSFVQFSLIFALGSLVNHPASNYWGTILALPWSPVSQFWFLHALFLIHLLAIAAWRLGGPRAVLGAALLVKLVAMFVPSLPALSLAAGNAPYYAFGMVLGWKRTSFLLTRASARTRTILYAGAAAAIIFLSSQADSIQPFIRVENASSASIAKIAWLPVMLPATLFGGAAVLLIADSLSRRSRVLAWAVEFVGRMTMPIFMLHVIFIAGTRILLVKLLGFNDVAALPLLVVVGVTGPLFARRTTDRLGLTSVLALR